MKLINTEIIKTMALVIQRVKRMEETMLVGFQALRRSFPFLVTTRDLK